MLQDRSMGPLRNDQWPGVVRFSQASPLSGCRTGLVRGPGLAVAAVEQDGPGRRVLKAGFVAVLGRGV